MTTSPRALDPDAGKRPPGVVHVLGAGPVGLFLTALLQSVPGQRVRLYERRAEYSRTRMVALAPYLIADSIEAYREDAIDGQDVEAIFDRAELEARLAYRRSVPTDLRELLAAWTLGFVPLNTIERSLSDLIDARATGTVERVAAELSVDDALALPGPGDTLVDCTGSRSLLRDQLLPQDGVGSVSNTQRYRMEHALVVTFLYDQHYACNEYCKYYKNVDNTSHKFIPAVHRTFHDGSVSHVTGIIGITEEEFRSMPPSFDGAWLRANHPAVSASMDRFIDKVRAETNGEIVGDLEIMRIPLEVYRARNMTGRRLGASGLDVPLARTPVFLLGDSAIGSPYFQSISLGFENAFFLAGHLGNRALPMTEITDRYETFMYQQWLRVYMRTQMIKHNKDLLETVDDTFALLERLHVF
jgi:hypothetical protein